MSGCNPFDLSPDELHGSCDRPECFVCRSYCTDCSGFDDIGRCPRCEETICSECLASCRTCCEGREKALALLDGCRLALQAAQCRLEWSASKDTWALSITAMDALDDLIDALRPEAPDVL